MLALAVFAGGLAVGSSLGVFSLLLLESCLCAAALVAHCGEGFGAASWAAVQMGATFTAGFVVALVALSVSQKLDPESSSPFLAWRNRPRGREGGATSPHMHRLARFRVDPLD